MTIKRRLGQLEFTMSCDDCAAKGRNTITDWQQNCQAVIDSAQAAGWNLAEVDYYADLCPKCAAEWKAQQEASV